MAGSQASGDNPVAINCIAMVDVIFCLCIFFFCSFHFRQLEGKMESWLPDRGGPDPSRPVEPWVDDEIRVALRCDPVSGAVTRRVLARSVPGDPDFRSALREYRAIFAGAGIADPRVAIEAEGTVPWADVVRVLDLSRQEGLRRIEFTANQAN